MGDWAQLPEIDDLDPATAPDVVVVQYTDRESTAGAAHRAVDPDGFDPTAVKLTTVTHTGVTGASNAARIGHQHRRKPKLAPFTFVGINSIIGDHVTVNAYASVGHDASVGDHCVMSPYSAITGRAVLEEGVFLGTHASVVPCVRVGRHSSIAAGAAVFRDVPAGSLMAGNPAKGRVMYRLD